MNIMAELALIFGVCLVGEGISAVLPFPFPASVIALILLGALLFSGLLKPRHIEKATGFLMSNMAFFFVPACVGIMKYADSIMGQLIPFVFIGFITTPVVYFVTGWTVQLMVRAGKKGGRHA